MYKKLVLNLSFIKLLTCKNMMEETQGIFGCWLVIENNFKLSGWHTDLKGSTYYFTKEYKLIVIDKNFRQTEFNYSIAGENLFITTTNGIQIEYKILKKEDGILVLENKMVDIKFTAKIIN